MIYKEDCLFLFRKDLLPEYRGHGIENLNIKMFFKPAIDVDKITNYYRHENVIIYVDPERRFINNLSGPRKGNIDSY
jgi:hypothetical protein